MTERNGEKPAVVYTIGQAARKLNRRPGTLRTWEASWANLPAELHPRRDGRGWRYYTEEQIEGLREWMRANDFRPGKGLEYYRPTPMDVERHVAHMRKPGSDG